MNIMKNIKNVINGKKKKRYLKGGNGSGRKRERELTGEQVGEAAHCIIATDDELHPLGI